MHKLLSLLCFAFILAGCAAHTPSVSPQKTATPASVQKVRTERIQLTQEQQQAAISVVKESLKDPYSAVFDSEVQGYKKVPPALGYTACGKVNAKNAYGAFTGKKLFAVDGSQVFLWREGNDIASIRTDQAILSRCGNY